MTEFPLSSRCWLPRRRSECSFNVLADAEGNAQRSTPEVWQAGGGATTSKLALWQVGILRRWGRQPWWRLHQRCSFGWGREWSRNSHQWHKTCGFADVMAQCCKGLSRRIKGLQRLEEGIRRTGRLIEKTCGCGSFFWQGRRLHQQRANMLHARKLLRRVLGERFWRFKRACPR